MKTKAARRAHLWDVARTRGVNAARDVLGSGCDPRYCYARSQREYDELSAMLDAHAKTEN